VHQGLSRLWLVPVLVCCCAPLFIGLAKTDLQNDEAIYSFAVDSILETGDWLNPRSSPDLNVVFLEKPPLKFWIVALPIRLGLLPHNEFGLRFWDALFGAMAFVYVFAIGWRMAGAMCGIVAVVVLFADPDLLFEHGLRNNNMEAPLVLCYCGAVYHFLAWGSAEAVRRRRWHAAAVGLYFFLGFMTKFVAALFLPAVLLSSALLSRQFRSRLREDARVWMWVAAGFVIFAAPWFIYQMLKPDSELWEIMFGAHVYARFTTGVDPDHLQPWHFYFRSIYRGLKYHGSAPLAIAGAIVVIADALRTRRVETLVVLLWFAIPIAVMTMSSSKLYHYAYPVLPPMALAAGYAPARVFRWITARMSAARFGSRYVPRLGTAARTALTVVAAIALVTAVYTIVFGPFRLELGPIVFRNRSLVRPLLLGVLAAILASRGTVAVRAAFIVLVLTLLPLDEYWRILERLPRARRPWSSASECLAQVAANQRHAGAPPPSVYAPIPEGAFLHVYSYYMWRVGDWERVAEPPPDALLHARLHDPSQQRAIVIGDRWYQDYRQRTAEESVPMISFGNVLLLMPGPYAVCSPERAASRR
jgi:4-amino-4-deoxy-L-arabinose transferase-like glycosyltransferase